MKRKKPIQISRAQLGQLGHENEDVPTAKATITSEIITSPSPTTTLRPALHVAEPTLTIKKVTRVTFSRPLEVKTKPPLIAKPVLSINPVHDVGQSSPVSPKQSPPSLTLTSPPTLLQTKKPKTKKPHRVDSTPPSDLPKPLPINVKPDMPTKPPIFTKPMYFKRTTQRTLKFTKPKIVTNLEFVTKRPVITSGLLIKPAEVTTTESKMDKPKALSLQYHTNSHRPTKKLKNVSIRPKHQQKLNQEPSTKPGYASVPLVPKPTVRMHHKLIHPTRGVVGTRPKLLLKPRTTISLSRPKVKAKNLAGAKLSGSLRISRFKPTQPLSKPTLRHKAFTPRIPFFNADKEPLFNNSMLIPKKPRQNARLARFRGASTAIYTLPDHNWKNMIHREKQHNQPPTLNNVLFEDEEGNVESFNISDNLHSYSSRPGENIRNVNALFSGRPNDAIGGNMYRKFAGSPNFLGGMIGETRKVQGPSLLSEVAWSSHKTEGVDLKGQSYEYMEKYNENEDNRFTSNDDVKKPDKDVDSMYIKVPGKNNDMYTVKIKHKKYHQENNSSSYKQLNSNSEVNNQKPINEQDSKNQVQIIQMPAVSPQTPDTYLCCAHKLPEDDQYIVEYRPLADKQTAHHMLLFACDEPFQTNSTWNCREMSPVCKNGGQTIMYAWAMNAPSLKMPTNVGFHVGGTSGFKYLVLQVHYLHVAKFKNGKVKDSSGLEIVLDKNNKRYLAGIYLLADGFTPIPPHENRSHIDMGCLYSEGPIFFPFRFRVHAHKLGVVITGYRVRNNEWTLIGRGDPQRPQAFYPVFHDVDIKPGDFVMGRCTYNSYSRNSTTLIGPTHGDEMCNFYIMYFYDSTMTSYSIDSFPCEEVMSEDIYNSFPDDSDIALNVMEEANRIKFAHYESGNMTSRAKMFHFSQETGATLAMQEVDSSTYEGYGVKELSYIPVKDWPSGGDFPLEGEMPLIVGQISGVAMLPNDSQIVVLHRADRYWDSRTFNWKNIVNKKYQTPIADNTMIWMDRLTGSVRKSRGKNLFYLPHGITIDRKGFIWVTDVASHQVYKMTPDLTTVLTLGQKFLPGSGYKRFCKPTDVAVMPNGDFFVGDGYCNSRVLKFNKEGKMILVIAADRKPNIGLFPEPNFMSVVHSVAVDPINKRLFVADRENGRILVFRATIGVFIQEIKVPQGAVYAVAYNPNQGGVLHFVTGPLSDKPVTLSGYTYSFISNSVVSQWAPEGGFTLPHDLTMTKDNLDTFVVEINPFKVWKFTQKTKSPRKKKK